ncbi:MAG: glycosyltransferase [Leptolyngbya sp. SIO1D8]|nr:glycosyltransferase [Leptolyngbya sp. SIO1D8]
MKRCDIRKLLVVDNNSSDTTAEIVQAYQSQWSQLRYCLERQQGAAFARHRGVQEAQSEWVGLLDDDTLPDSNWVAETWAFAQTHDQTGAFSGQISGQFETPPPEGFKRIRSFLAIRERGHTPHLYNPETLVLPPAAMLVVHRQAWLTSVPAQPLMKGRLGDSMLGGEDFEVLLHMHQQGWQIWYAPSVKASHYIPSWRLERSYLLSLIQGASLTIAPLRLMYTPFWKKGIVGARIVLGNLKRLIVHSFKYRHQLRRDVVVDCEMAFFFWSMLSPFYALKLALRWRT